MQIHHLAEVVAVDGQGDGQRKKLRAAEERPEDELPVMDALLAQDAPKHTKVVSIIYQLRQGLRFDRGRIAI